MAKYLLLLLLLLSKVAYGQSCYCTTNWFTNTSGQSYCIANTSCWACQPGAYNSGWQSLFCSNYVAPAPVVTCQTSFIEKTESCPANFSGIKKYKQENQTCTDGRTTQGSWQLYADTCTPNPPTCNVSVESRTEACGPHQSGLKTYNRSSSCPNPYGAPVWNAWMLSSNTCKPDPATCIPTVESKTESCQVGYNGSVLSTRSSSCPDPYGQPVWTGWSITSNSCVKSVTNPTNTLSPISPTSVVTPTPTVSSTPSVTVSPTVEMPVSDITVSEVPSSAPPSQTPSVTSDAPSQGSSAPAPSVGSIAKSLSLVQRLDNIGAIKLQPQPSLTTSLITLQQELDENVRRQQDFLLDLIANDANYDLVSSDQRIRLGRILWSNPIQSSYGSD